MRSNHQPAPKGLIVEAVTVDFSGLRALDTLSFRVARRQIVGLVGPSKAGKSTLVNVITGFLKATQGRIWLDSVEITDWPAHKTVSLGVARTFQNVKLFPELTVLENLHS